MDHILDSIRIVPIEHISVFEWDSGSAETPKSDDGVTVIKHPLPVTKQDEDDYILLEQTERFCRYRASGIRHLPVQIYEQSSLKLVNGRLVLSGFGYQDLSRLVSAHPEQVQIRQDDGEPPSGFLSARIEFVDHPAVRLLLRHSSRSGCPASIDLLFRAFAAHGQYLPELHPGVRPDTPFKVATPTAWLSPLTFGVEDVVSAAATGKTFPPGLIHVQTPFRVFNIDFPVSVLESELPAAEKETFLRDLILYREQGCRTTYFDGPVYILNR